MTLVQDRRGWELTAPRKKLILDVVLTQYKEKLIKQSSKKRKEDK